MKLSPQAQLVLRHLQSVGSITNVEANAVHKVRSVSRRITEIQDAGVKIAKVRRRDHTGQVYVRYSLTK
ncbi:helix-turn-helix domain-containing protein [Caballeronia sp. LZ032]|uniref:helix-turn-helix domain-containing protein n=1 Tax=Caballeronia sp. LZ032 TaxID=3038565 RepID=UPI002856485C|nr:helix-turn-helix domain-containing protein [Caballeronia sp. LZ032]MDR5879043.1 helix-turn-helix domain-containing protein [Caballeronia sp. LZ032]